MAQPDLAIRGARILDGSGAPAFDGDLAVRGERIEAVGSLAAGAARREIDARGLALAPGFVDAHTHDDGALLAHPGMEFKLSQGVTSVVVGNCGFSAAPLLPGRAPPPASAGLLGAGADWTDLRGYLAAVERARPALNAIALVGHNHLRAQVVGTQDRAPSAAELAEMRGAVDEALEQGACGFSTGLVYTPGRFAATEEVVELARPLRGHGALYATHMRNEGDGLLESIEETLRIGREAGCAVHVSHHKAAGLRNFGRVSESLARIDRANREGLDVTLDVYPYTASSGPMAEYFRLDRLDLALAAVTRLASCPDFPEWEGRGLGEIADEIGASLEEVARRVLTAPRARATICIQFIMDEADVEANLRHPRAMVGSDGIPDLRGRPHPRLFGTCPRVLARYVRERGVLPLPEAVRRMTSLPCERFGLAGRGRIAPGAFADLVLFDPERVADLASYAEPKRVSVGIELVVVNGAIALERGRHTGAGAGRALRYRKEPAGGRA
jgi:N-acyl-D-aspartate/D-glutamate deacylase